MLTLYYPFEHDMRALSSGIYILFSHLTQYIHNQDTTFLNKSVTITYIVFEAAVDYLYNVLLLIPHIA